MRDSSSKILELSSFFMAWNQMKWRSICRRQSTDNVFSHGDRNCDDRLKKNDGSLKHTNITQRHTCNLPTGSNPSLWLVVYLSWDCFVLVTELWQLSLLSFFFAFISSSLSYKLALLTIVCLDAVLHPHVQKPHNNLRIRINQLVIFLV